MPGLIGGSVIIESIFALPGLGQLFYGAVMARDYTMIMGNLVLGAVLTLAGNPAGGFLLRNRRPAHPQRKGQRLMLPRAVKKLLGRNLMLALGACYCACHVAGRTPCPVDCAL